MIVLPDFDFRSRRKHSAIITVTKHNGRRVQIMFHQVLQTRIIGGDLCYVVVPLWFDVCEDRGCT